MCDCAFAAVPATVCAAPGTLTPSYCATVLYVHMSPPAPQTPVERHNTASCTRPHSAGGLFALFLALGTPFSDAEQLVKLLDPHTVMIDTAPPGCGVIAMALRYARNWGMFSGRVFRTTLENMVEVYSGDRNLTFLGLLELRGTELAIVVTNPNVAAVEYLHVKTTPHMRVVDAVVAATSVPPIYPPMQRRVWTADGNMAVDTLTDACESSLALNAGECASVRTPPLSPIEPAVLAIPSPNPLTCVIAIRLAPAVLNNFPLRLWDGWWLSLRPQDAFLNRMRPFTDIHKYIDDRVRFAPRSASVLGLTLFSDLDWAEVTRGWVRPGGEPPPMPNTPLARAKARGRASQDHEDARRANVEAALERFLHAMVEGDDNRDGVISEAELRRAVAGGLVLPGDMVLLFGTSDVQRVMRYLDIDRSGTVSYVELMRVASVHNVDLAARGHGVQRRTFTGPVQMLGALVDAVAINLERMSVSHEDYERVAAINTGCEL